MASRSPSSIAAIQCLTTKRGSAPPLFIAHGRTLSVWGIDRPSAAVCISREPGRMVVSASVDAG